MMILAAEGTLTEHGKDGMGYGVRRLGIHARLSARVRTTALFVIADPFEQGCSVYKSSRS